MSVVGLGCESKSGETIVGCEARHRKELVKLVWSGRQQLVSSFSCTLAVRRPRVLSVAEPRAI
jgi:hypothetical protein